MAPGFRDDELNRNRFKESKRPKKKPAGNESFELTDEEAQLAVQLVSIASDIQPVLSAGFDSGTQQIVNNAFIILPRTPSIGLDSKIGIKQLAEPNAVAVHMESMLEFLESRPVVKLLEKAQEFEQRSRRGLSDGELYGLSAEVRSSIEITNDVLGYFIGQANFPDFDDDMFDRPASDTPPNDGVIEQRPAEKSGGRGRGKGSK